MKQYKHIWLVILLVAFPMVSYAKNINQDVVQRLERLEKDTQLLAKRIFQQKLQKPENIQNGENKSLSEMAQDDLTGNILTDFELRLVRLEKNMSILYGKFESLDYAIGTLNKSYNLFTDDTEYRLREVEKLLDSNGLHVNQNMSSNDSKKKLPPNTLGVITQGKSDPKVQQTGEAKETPQTIYDSGFAKLRSGKYLEAKEILAGFMKSYPEHELAGSVEYWLGETNYVMGDYKNAIMHFGDAYRKYPKNSKSDESLLKLSMSLSKVGRKKEACLALDQLVNNLQDVPKSVKRQAEAEMQKNQCR